MAQKIQKYGLIYVKITLVYRPIFVVFGKNTLKLHYNGRQKIGFFGMIVPKT